MERLDRCEEILAYLIHASSGRVGRTQLVKLMYMADFESYRYLGRPVSQFHWTRQDHGPFDPSFFEVKDSLEARGLLKEEMHDAGGGRTRHVCHAAGTLPELSLSSAERRILEHVVGAYSKMSRQRLVNDVVYKTRPFCAVRDAEHGTPIPLADVANEGRAEVDGLDLDEIERGREEVRAGRGIPLSEAMHALRRSS